MPPHCYIGHMSYYFLLLAAVNVNAFLQVEVHSYVFIFYVCIS